jgi:hypothetical protein
LTECGSYANKDTSSKTLCHDAFADPSGFEWVLQPIEPLHEHVLSVRSSVAAKR